MMNIKINFGGKTEKIIIKFMENSNRDLTSKLLKQVESFEEKYLNKEFEDKKHFNNELKLLVRNTIFVCEKILKDGT